MRQWKSIPENRMVRMRETEDIIIDDAVAYLKLETDKGSIPDEKTGSDRKECTGKIKTDSTVSFVFSSGMFLIIKGN